MLNVLKAPGFEVVDADHPVAAGDQVVAEVRAEEPGSASYNDSTHLNLMVIGGRPWDNWPIDQVRPPRQVLALAGNGPSGLLTVALGWPDATLEEELIRSAVL